jgi:hypothetical protein
MRVSLIRFERVGQGTGAGRNEGAGWVEHQRVHSVFAGYAHAIPINGLSAREVMSIARSDLGQAEIGIARRRRT